MLAFLAILEEAQTLALDKLERVVLVPTIFLYSVKKLVCRMNLSDTRRFFVNHLVCFNMLSDEFSIVSNIVTS